jgi:uncharacterized protein YndB with AHSA1/START domain
MFASQSKSGVSKGAMPTAQAAPRHPLRQTRGDREAMRSPDRSAGDGEPRDSEQVRDRVVEPPERLDYTFAWEEPDPDDRETLVSLTFRAVPEGTLVVLDQGAFATEARYDLHRDGWTDTLERLALFFA